MQFAHDYPDTVSSLVVIGGPATLAHSSLNPGAWLAQVQREQRAAKVAPAFQNPVGVGPVAPFQPAAGWHTSVASVYTDYGKPIACGGVLAPTSAAKNRP